MQGLLLHEKQASFKAFGDFVTYAPKCGFNLQIEVIISCDYILSYINNIINICNGDETVYLYINSFQTGNICENVYLSICS